MAEWIFKHSWYGRGSKDYDTYSCSGCGRESTVGEDIEPSPCTCPPKTKDNTGSVYLPLGVQQLGT